MEQAQQALMEQADRLLNQAEQGFANLSPMVRAQAVAVLLPMLALLRLIVVELKKQGGKNGNA